MAGLIQTIPAGFLSLFQAKEMGANPNLLGTEVQPTIEMLPFYLAQRRQVQELSHNIAAVGSATLITVPGDEVWLIEECINVSPILGAGQLLEHAVIWLRNGLQVQRGEYRLVPSAGTLGSAQLIGRDGLPFIAMGGDAFGVNTAQLAAGPVNGCAFRLTYVPLR